jgi:hypothetical protein
MNAPPVTVILIPAPNEPAPEGLEKLQAKMAALPLNRRHALLRLKAVAPPASGVSGASSDATLGTVLGLWLQTGSGRKARLKIGEIEAEAQSRGDVEELLAHA